MSKYRQENVLPIGKGNATVTKAATILRLLGNETIQFNTRGKKSEPGLRKQLNVEVKYTTKFNFFSLNILIYLYILLI